MLEVECNHCHFKNKVQFTPEIAGKRIMFKCKNKKCSEFITLKLPQRLVKEKVTEIFEIPKVDSEGKGFLEYTLKNQTIRFPLNPGNQILGRISSDYTPDIALENNDSSVSRKHCAIEGIKDSNKLHYIIKDNGSTNGTKLNGQKLFPEDELYLEVKDEIEIGMTKLVFNYFK